MNSKHLESSNDEVLVDLILASGNAKIFEEIYDRYAGKIYNKCFSFTHDEKQAEDFSHDILLKVYTRLSTFRKGSKFSTWVYAITYNHCVDKQKQTKKEREQQENYLLSEYEEVEETADEDLFQIQVDRLKILLQQLTLEERTILLLKYQDDFSIKQLSEFLKINDSAVKMRLKRAKAKLLSNYKDKYAHNIV